MSVWECERVYSSSNLSYKRLNRRVWVRCTIASLIASPDVSG